MSKTNCVNCGSAKDIDALKCPFCGTTYLDFTAIDFDSDAPVVCSFVLPWVKEKTIMQMVAIPHLDAITAEPTFCTYHGDGLRLSMEDSMEVNVGVSFRPVMRNGALFSIRKGEQE